MLQGLFFFFIIAALSSAQQKCPQRRPCHFFMQTDSGRFLRPLSLSKGRRTAKNRRHFPARKNGKQAIFYGLSGVPRDPTRSIAGVRQAHPTATATPPLQSLPCLHLLTEFSQKTPGQAPPATIPAVP